MLTHSLSSLLNFSPDHELWSLLQASCKYELCLQAKECKIPTSYKTNRRREEGDRKKLRREKELGLVTLQNPGHWEAEAGPHHWGQGLGSKENSRLGWWLSETLGAGDVPVIKCECARSPGFHLQHIKRSGGNRSGQRQLGSVLIKNTNILQPHSPPPPLWTGQFPCLGLI